MLDFLKKLTPRRNSALDGRDNPYAKRMRKIAAATPEQVAKMTIKQKTVYMNAATWVHGHDQAAAAETKTRTEAEALARAQTDEIKAARIAALRTRTIVHDDPTQRDAINAFVQLLWERGSKFENEVIAGLERPFLNLRQYSGAEKERRTLEAMRGQEPLIYGGRISADDLLGDPDLLEWRDGGYVAGDIKSGAGLESAPDDDEDGKPKKHYAAQLALYTDILERLGFARAKKPFVWDIHGQEVTYDLDAPVTKTAKQSFWEFYQEILAQARQIRDQQLETEPAYSTPCKLCHWYSNCKNQLIDSDDLTLLPGLARATKNRLLSFFGTTAELAERDLTEFNQGKKAVIKGVGYDTLVKFQQRARLRQSGGKPYPLETLTLPSAPVELFYDIEVDPMREICLSKIRTMK